MYAIDDMKCKLMDNKCVCTNEEGNIEQYDVPQQDDGYDQASSSRGHTLYTRADDVLEKGLLIKSACVQYEVDGIKCRLNAMLNECECIDQDNQPVLGGPPSNGDNAADETTENLYQKEKDLKNGQPFKWI